MKRIKKLCVIFNGYVDRVISAVEDPEITLKNVIKELNKQKLKARVNIEKSRRNLELLKTQIRKVEDEKKKWEKRAREQSSINRDVALACVKEAKRRDEELKRLNNLLDQQKECISRAEGYVSELESKYDELKAKLYLFSSKKAVVDAVKQTDPSFMSRTLELSEMVEEVEDKLLEVDCELELFFGVRNSSEHSLDKKFVAQEEKEELEEELAKLLTEE
ncbi:MAG: hypothetical protein D6780_00475 [Candidatus Dadabacteria bacterium]|nr:MAG: hypothetical protein D6780_00475 [Candidatus Dadabacteria bacterium]